MLILIDKNNELANKSKSNEQLSKLINCLDEKKIGPSGKMTSYD